MKRTHVDEYYNDGIFECIRSGRISKFAGILKGENKESFLRELIANNDKLKEQIDSEVHEIREMVSVSNPIQILLFASGMFQTSLLGTYSEFQIKGEKMASGRLCEYVQSILVSTPNVYVDSDEDQSSLYFSILEKFDNLLSLVNDYILSWAAKLHEENRGQSETFADEAIESQLLYYVRGNRYQVFESQYYRGLLNVHNDEFIRRFGITAEDVVDGFSKLEYSIAQGKMDPFNELRELMDTFDSDDMDEEKYENMYGEKCGDIFSRAFTAKNNDVKDITNWPDSFITGLAYQIDEVSSFFASDSDYAGWPIIDLPIQIRPFITIDDHTYCFDYYSFTDNFYRAVQRLLCPKGSQYNWKERQAEGSEKLVGEIFSKLLPGCVVHRNNYYPMHNSMKQLSENDLLIQYEDAILIVEVKAGAFVYTSPLEDYQTHIRSYKTLIEKADHQCSRTFKYIDSNDKTVFYNNDKSSKFSLQKSAYEYVYQFSVTVDNINEVAARAEKMGFLELESNAISISIDDLLVYSEYFKSPLMFMHFLKQRKAATSIPTLALNDELDHLGLYIKDKCYTYKMESLDPKNKYFYTGYREDLDEYFGSLYYEKLSILKPIQEIPEEMLNMIDVISKGKEKNKIWLSSYILDFSGDFRADFCDRIRSIYKRQCLDKREFPIIYNGKGKSVHLSCFVRQNGISSMSEREREDYLYATMIWNGEKIRARLDLYYNEDGILTDISGHEYAIDEIDLKDYDRLKQLGAKNAELRVELYKQKHKKIGRNELCPCGSGKKYKYCCGKS